VKENNIFVPLKTLIGVAADVQNSLAAASLQLEYKIKTEVRNWEDTAIPELCNYYSCLYSLKKFVAPVLDPFGVSDIVPDQQVEIPVDELQILTALLHESDMMREALTKHGISLVVH